MKPGRSHLRRLVAVLIVLAGFLVGTPSGEAKAAGAPPRPSPTPGVTGQERMLDLRAIDTPEHRTQVQRVVEAMDRTGAPPKGVSQGGRRGGQKGVFQNAEGRLPRKPRGYWIESDVWPKNGPRDAERLIFGREGEVYWTRDHYETFVRLR
jgi:guanyl-specific ribonuclease Sa